MDLILDGEPQAMDTSECANLAELVSMAETTNAEGEETVVVAVEIDGEVLSPEDLADLERRPLEGIGRVAIQRRSTRAVAFSVLTQGADYCGQIEAAIDECVGEFRTGRSDRGNEILADITDSLTVLTGITVSVANILAESAQALADIQTGIFPWLEELVEAQSQEDPLRIADLLDYEIKPRIGNWSVVMRAQTSGEASEGETPLSS